MKLLVVLAIVAIGSCADEWWETSIFYQIYPRSFQDTDGDGVGDLKGITDRLQHLKNLGIEATWISPINTSPMVDAGYDISDFRDIDPLFGNMADYEHLLKEAKRLGIKVIMDFVPNHSSDKHEWFEKSIQRVEPYTDYYVWRDGKIVNGTQQPPNNWLSGMSHDSAWTWNEERGQYYYHQFTVEQPDLNYRNPLLVQEMKDILTFWLDKGVHGFRVDALYCLFEHESFDNEPKSNNPSCGPLDACYLTHNLTQDQPETIDMVVQWRQVLKEHSSKTGESYVLMTETWSPMDVLMDYYGNSTHEGASFPFNFDFIFLSKDSKAAQYKEIIDRWVERVPMGKTLNWVMGSHDQKRVATRLGIERVDSLNMIGLTLPGVAVTYNGEEIGMENTFITWEETQDPQALNAGEENYLSATRDPERTPFQWNNEKNAGFSTADKTWLPVNTNYQEINLEKQIYEWSHYRIYKRLVALRELETLKKGELKVEVLEADVLVIKRSGKGLPTVVTVANLNGETKTVDLGKVEIPKEMVIYVASVGASLANLSVVQTNKLVLKPYESYVLTDIE